MKTVRIKVGTEQQVAKNITRHFYVTVNKGLGTFCKKKCLKKFTKQKERFPIHTLVATTGVETAQPLNTVSAQPLILIQMKTI